MAATVARQVIDRVIGRVVRRIAGRIVDLRLARRRDPERDAAEGDPLAAYWAPPRPSREPPYASLRQ
jgi:hypothetical protein